MAAVAQIEGIEISVELCARRPAVAGRLVFDLDPAPDLPFFHVITAAREVRVRLKPVGLESFCRATEGKGLHIVTPLLGGKDAVKWPASKDFAHLICTQKVHGSPGQFLDNMSDAQRVGKIFLYYLRDDRTPTAVCVLSSRARAGVPVSMPLPWSHVQKAVSIHWPIPC